MKKYFSINIFILLFFITNPSQILLAAYEATTLFNSVTRAETVQGLYFKRWDDNLERNIYFDLYGKINTVGNLKVNTYNAGTQSYTSTKLDLVRTYGSLSIAFPVNGFRKTPKEEDLIIVLNTAGFHYGLTREIYLPVQGIAGSTVTDYKFSQFFDDIYAVSVLWRPYIIFHGGIIVTNEYLPTADGSIKYSDPEKSSTSGFVSLDFYRLISLKMNVKGITPESFKTKINLNTLTGYSPDSSNIYIPLAYLEYENKLAFSDEQYDPVWSGTPDGKSNNTDFSGSSARINLISVSINQRITENYSIEGFYGAQYIDNNIYSKVDMKKVSPPLTKEWFLKICFDPMYLPYNSKSNAYFGLSSYWDPAVSTQRDKHNKGNNIYGWIVGYDFDFIFLGGGFKIEKSFSTDLKPLIETVDKYQYDFNLFIRV